VAAAIVTAKIGPFAKSGTRLDVTVSSIGDATSLQGGTLLMTPLRGPDGRVYAVAQGPVSIGGFMAAGAGAKTQKNHPTVGKVPDGAIVERELTSSVLEGDSLTLKLMEPDFTTAARVTEAINKELGDISRTINPGVIEVSVPANWRSRLVEFVSKVEAVNVQPDLVARVVIDERTGTVVIGRDVKVDTVAVAHGNLSVVIKTELDVSQPYPKAGGETVVTPSTELEVTEGEQRLMLMQEAVTIKDVVTSLNAIGVTPRDLMAILQSIKAAGALRAELKII